jgi:hypothetical protein
MNQTRRDPSRRANCKPQNQPPSRRARGVLLCGRAGRAQAHAHARARACCTLLASLPRECAMQVGSLCAASLEVLKSRIHQGINEETSQRTSELLSFAPAAGHLRSHRQPRPPAEATGGLLAACVDRNWMRRRNPTRSDPSRLLLRPPPGWQFYRPPFRLGGHF